MRSVRIVCIVSGLVAFSAAPALSAAAESPTAKEFASLHWSTGAQSLGDSHATFNVPEGGRLVTGNDAKRADEIVNGENSSDVEGFLDFHDGSVLYMTYDDSGYVTADDWKDVNADDILKSIKDNTEAGNDERVKNGASAMHVDGWVRPPKFDEARKSLSWIITAHDDHGSTLNAVALQLGRHGYERFTYATGANQVEKAQTMLDALVADYQFKPGFRFSDYVSGDKVAGYGLAALVAAGAGATLAKTGALAALLLFAKKFIILILAGLAAAFNGIKRMFKKKPDPWQPATAVAAATPATPVAPPAGDRSNAGSQ